MKKKSAYRFAASVVAILASASAFVSPALAQYSYVRIDAGNLTSGLYPGTLNNQGVVAFTGFHAGEPLPDRPVPSPGSWR